MIVVVSILQFYDIGSLQEFSSGFAQVHVAQSPSLAVLYLSSNTCSSLYHFSLQPPISTLFPLHYDAVSALAVYSNALFSACGVSIKQWDVANQTINKVSTLVHGSVH